MLRRLPLTAAASSVTRTLVAAAGSRSKSVVSKPSILDDLDAWEAPPLTKPFSPKYDTMNPVDGFEMPCHLGVKQSVLPSGLTVISYDTTSPNTVVASIGMKNTTSMLPGGESEGLYMFLGNLLGQAASQETLMEGTSHNVEIFPGFYPGGLMSVMGISSRGGEDTLLSGLSQVLTAPQIPMDTDSAELRDFCEEASALTDPYSLATSGLAWEAMYGIKRNSYTTATTPKMMKFLGELTRADNAALVTVGIDHKEACEKASAMELLEVMVPQPFTPISPFPSLPPKDGNHVTVDMSVEDIAALQNVDPSESQVGLSMNFPVNDFGEEFFNLAVASTILGTGALFQEGGPGSGLNQYMFKTLVGSLHPSISSAEAVMQASQCGNLFQISARASPGRADYVATNMLFHMSKVAFGMSEAAFERGKRHHLNKAIASYQAPEKLAVEGLLLFQGGSMPWSLDEFLQKTNAVTFEGCKTAFQKSLSGPMSTTLVAPKSDTTNPFSICDPTVRNRIIDAGRRNGLAGKESGDPSLL